MKGAFLVADWCSTHIQCRQAFSFQLFSCHQHYRRAVVLVLLQQAMRRVLHLRQKSKISRLLLPTHKFLPANARDLFCVAYDVLTDVVQQ